MRMRFRFRLESILKLREHEEELAREKLLRIRTEISDLEERLSNLEFEESKYKRKMMESMRKGVSGGEIREWILILDLLKMERDSILNDLRKLRDMEQKALDDYLDKRKERKALEKLKERSLRDHLEEIERAERISMDEVAERRHHWNPSI
ncbi:MAG: flagellar export protein FliJ [Thermotoga sp.]|nr:MAG: flagellar export protein FliJ [Thermotoga sp.]